MATAELQTPGQVDLDGFETVHDGAAQSWRPSVVGDAITGEYTGTDVISLTGGEEFTLYFLKGTDGQLYSVANSYMIDQCFGRVRIGDVVRLSYLGEIELGASRNPMRNFTIAVRR